MPSISAVIITLNEEQYLDRCLSSLEDVVDEIVVVDSFSTDQTKQIAKSYNARFIQHAFEGYIEQKNWAMMQASHDYVLSLDGDEMLSGELRSTIKKIKNNLEFDGYYVNRLNNYYGQWIRHSGVYPNRKIRLFNRTRGQWGGINPHDQFVLHKGARKYHLKGDLLHYMYSSLEDHLDKMLRFTSISAAAHFKRGIRSNAFKLIIHPAWRFFRGYLINQGFRDGMTGYIICYLNAYAGYMKYLKLKNFEKGDPPVFLPNEPSTGDTRATIKIGFDAKRVFHNETGLGNYSRDTIRLLSSYWPSQNYVLYNPKPGHIQVETNPENTAIRYPDTWWNRHFSSYWRYRLMVSQLVRDRIDIYFGLSNEIPHGIERTKIKTLVTIHDLIFLRYPHYYKTLDRNIYKEKFRNACLKAHKIIAISEQTKADIIQFFDIPENKIEVVYQGCNRLFQETVMPEQLDAIRKKYSLPERYILNVGRIEERKNALSLVRAIQPVEEIHLVIAGRKTPYYYEIQEFIETHQMKDRVHFLSPIPMADLPAVYQMADIFVYPSFFEGFGIPIIEALFSKIPVISSTGSCFSEAGGPDSRYVPPDNITALSEAIQELWNNPALRKAMAEKGYRYAAQFKDPVVARKLQEVIASLIG